MSFEPVTPTDVGVLRDFLSEVDLTLAGLDAPTVKLWIERGIDGCILGTTGYELSADGRHALIRSVAVAPTQRAKGAGSRLAKFALTDAARQGATRAWLFSRRSGPFWQNLGFQAADRHELALALPRTHQVRLFVDSGQLEREIAWSRQLNDLAQ
ncbi:GNAT family N-acetyltransferase [Paeniglutamicibacter antarcticus]|uniref:GNAT family N-acetyltransferase n=1 Tax=Arthrobacter terrae TaxID=2935737 RepID=A0A931CRT1_9MICC|nr:GNAT family N-acetyltransferase [Arthrobacter terrae]MBG0741812.1 GNAT family N-acetyltransferase [Arthrobacter terrae]